MVKNDLLELIKEREKTYVKITEQAINMFIQPLKEAMEKAFFDSNSIELYILDVGIVPQNFRFLRVDGKLITVNVGDKLDIDGENVEVDLENLWDFAKQFSIIIPAALLDDAETDQIVDYLIKVKNNNDKIPESIMKENKVTPSDNEIKEFQKINKELDDSQLMELKYLKSSSIH